MLLTIGSAGMRTMLMMLFRDSSSSEMKWAAGAAALVGLAGVLGQPLGGYVVTTGLIVYGLFRLGRGLTRLGK